MYEEIKKNIIEHFFNTHYLWACCVNKKFIFDNMQNNCPFNIIVNENGNTIIMNLGNNINISFNLKWEERHIDNSKYINYRLISIS